MNSSRKKVKNISTKAGACLGGGVLSCASIQDIITPICENYVTFYIFSELIIKHLSSSNSTQKILSLGAKYHVFKNERPIKTVE